MTPTTAANNSFSVLVNILGWKSLTPTQAAHAVQINADPNFYTTYWDDSVAVGLRPREWCSFPGSERRIVDVKSHRGMVSE
jgi:hypothetical protein